VSSHTVDDFLVDRFSIAPARALTQSQITAIAGQLLTPPVAGAAVLVQSPHSAN
jgi:Na+(H+)/acetate symporter ActP